MTQPLKGNGGSGTGGSFNPPVQGGNTNTFNVGLLTSTGGLSGITGLLMTPYKDQNGNGFIVVHDYTNFDCEENAEYDYPEYIPMDLGAYQEGQIVNCHLIKLKYRELGIANFIISVSAFNRNIDDFVTVNIPVAITNTNNRKTFPDKKIHTRFIGINPIISGERPQPKILRKVDSGPISITKLILCGNADEIPQI